MIIQENNNIMKNTFILFLLSIPFLGFGQAIAIECPADVTVHLFDLDTNYESYGEPTVHTNESYTLDKSITRFSNSCVDNYTEITYTAENNAQNAAWCIQRIDITSPEIVDFVLPADITIDNTDFDGAGPEVTGYPEPWEFLTGQSTIAAAYTDVNINPPAGSQTGKILRKWTLVDWCSTETMEYNQIIRITNFQTNTNGALFQVSSCYGQEVDVFDVQVRSSDPNVVLDYGSCALSGSDLVSYMNCIASENDLAANNSYVLELEGPDDFINGVSTLDIVYTQRHILAIDPFEDICQVIASDVSNDQMVTALDLLKLRRLILNVDAGFQDSESWKFFNADFLDSNGQDQDADLKFSQDEFPLSGLQVKAVKIGDINGSALK